MSRIRCSIDLAFVEGCQTGAIRIAPARYTYLSTFSELALSDDLKKLCGLHAELHRFIVEVERLVQGYIVSARTEMQFPLGGREFP